MENKKQVKIIFNGILIVVGLLLLAGIINNVVLQTLDVLEDVPHIMDTPPDDTLDINIDSTFNTK
tara:strand:- start:400 stop:594 length:195 start_codon:yes stop_codon:yes gene_type:complete